MHVLVLLLAAACSPEPADEITFGACEESPVTREATTDTAWEDDGSIAVFAEWQDDVLLVFLYNLTANCCPDPVATWREDGAEIRVDFDDLAPGATGCRCACVMDFQVSLTGVPAGDQTVRVFYDGVDIGTAYTGALL